MELSLFVPSPKAVSHCTCMYVCIYTTTLLLLVGCMCTCSKEFGRLSYSTVQYIISLYGSGLLWHYINTNGDHVTCTFAFHWYCGDCNYVYIVFCGYWQRCICECRSHGEGPSISDALCDTCMQCTLECTPDAELTVYIAQFPHVWLQFKCTCT